MLNLVGILTAVMGKIPFIGQLLAKLWTDNSKVAEIKAEEDLEETKAFTRGRLSPKFLLRYVVVVSFALFVLFFLARMIWPDFAPGMTMDNFERLMRIAGNILGALF